MIRLAETMGAIALGGETMRRAMVWQATAGPTGFIVSFMRLDGDVVVLSKVFRTYTSAAIAIEDWLLEGRLPS